MTIAYYEKLGRKRFYKVTLGVSHNFFIVVNTLKNRLKCLYLPGIFMLVYKDPTNIMQARKQLLRGMLHTVDLFLLASLDQLKIL
jgi:hypothetical protein